MSCCCRAAMPVGSARLQRTSTMTRASRMGCECAARPVSSRQGVHAVLLGLQCTLPRWHSRPAAGVMLSRLQTILAGEQFAVQHRHAPPDCLLHAGAGAEPSLPGACFRSNPCRCRVHVLPLFGISGWIGHVLMCVSALQVFDSFSSFRTTLLDHRFGTSWLSRC